LEIGSTISHFFIASLLCIFVAALEGVSEMFITGVEVEDSNGKRLAKEKQLGAVVTNGQPFRVANGNGKKGT
jgi:phosphatidylinositol glycan class N